MRFGELQDTKEIGEGRKRLLELEKEGKYVFHGSPNLVEILEPRQAYTSDDKSGKDIKDGKSPAVFASPYADAAIYRALSRRENVTGDSENAFGMKDDGTIYFTASQKLIDAAKSKIGKVYVLDKAGFSEPLGTDVKTENPVKPILVIDVTVDDLPDYIKIVE